MHEVFYHLGYADRLAVLNALHEHGAMTVGDATRMLGGDPSRSSAEWQRVWRHLRHLQKCGLVESDSQGYYSVTAKIRAVAEYAQRWL